MFHSRRFAATLRHLVLALAFAAVSIAADAQTAANVLVIVNDLSPASVQIAEYYARKRDVPAENVLHLSVAAAEQISRADYQRAIEAPIAAWFGRTRAHDRILYIVLTKGIPLRIAGTAGRDATMASVDSELALLYRRMVGIRIPILGRIENPYYAGDREEAGAAKRFDHERHDIYLVTRLDGFTVPDVLGLIDRAAAPPVDGKIVLDQRVSPLDRSGNLWLRKAADRLASRGFGERVVLETTQRVVTGERNVLGYYSWGSKDPGNTLRHLDITFVPGALAAMFVSSDGRTFVEPPANWKVRDRDQVLPAFAGSSESLAGDLIRDGITGVAAHVAEPFLDATVRPDVLFPAYVSGFNLAESFYQAVPYLSWQTIIVGDPLCEAVPAERIPSDRLDAGLDPRTELPRFFAARRLDAIARPSRNRDALALMVRAESRLARSDIDGARADLERALVLDSRLAEAHHLLAQVWRTTGDDTKLIEQYRAAVAIGPSDVVALNNLAEALATRANQPDSALPFAERAYQLSPTTPSVVDTLAWILHLLGKDQAAAGLFFSITSQMTGEAAIHLHAAIVFDAVGQRAASARELARAVKLSPELATDDDVIQLLAKQRERD